MKIRQKTLISLKIHNKKSCPAKKTTDEVEPKLPPTCTTKSKEKESNRRLRSPIIFIQTAFRKKFEKIKRER